MQYVSAPMHAASIAFYLVLQSSPLVHAQGSLTPPGAPAPTMKTLDQVEARTPIGPSTTTVTISAPGSYYLAGNIETTSTGISITSGNVTLDLNGFTVSKSSSGVSSSGIAISGSSDGSKRNVTVRNGHISGAFTSGISISAMHNVTVEDLGIEGSSSEGIGTRVGSIPPNNLTIRRCRVLGTAVTATDSPTLSGMFTAGIAASFAMTCIIEDCVVANLTGDGIQMLTGNGATITSSGIIRGCVVSRCGDTGIDLFTNSTTPLGILIERCTVDQSGISGIALGCSGRIVDCISNGNTSGGILAASRSVHITGCHTENNGGDGIRVASDSLVQNCVCDSNGAAGDGAGIHVTGTDNVIRENAVTDNVRGLDIDSSSNLIYKNTASGNTLNFDIAANNRVGVIVAAPNSAAIIGSTGGIGVGTTDPWANISF